MLGTWELFALTHPAPPPSFTYSHAWSFETLPHQIVLVKKLKYFLSAKRDKKGRKYPASIVFLSPPPSLQELLIPTKAELVTQTVTIGIAAKPLHKKNQGKNKKPQNKTKQNKETN
jgi:hypothetical protein